LIAGRVRNAGYVQTGGRGRNRIRFPARDGDSRQLDQAAEGGERRRLEHGQHRPHADQQEVDGKNSRLLRIARSGEEITLNQLNTKK